MEKYMIVSLIFEDEILSDLYDIEFDEFQERMRKAIREAKSKGVSLFFRDIVNDRAVTESFATVEYNFDISKEEKDALIKYIAPFFSDGIISRKTMNIINNLRAVRFLQTNGELVRI